MAKRFLIAAVVGAFLNAIIPCTVPAQKVSTLPNASTPFNGTELLYMAQQGLGKKTTLGALASYFFNAIGGNVLPQVPSNAILAASATALYPSGVLQLGFYTKGDAPQILEEPLVGKCAANGLVADHGSCTDTTVDGNSWKAVFPSGLIDIRIFGAKPDGATDSYAAITAADVYSSGIGACTYVPSVFPGFVSLTSVQDNGCMRGDRGIKLYPQVGPVGQGFGKFVDINFPGDTDGITIATNHNGWFLGDLAIKGHAAEATSSSTHTRGVYLNGPFDGVIQNMFVQDFVVCKYALASANKYVFRDISCDEQTAYPNIVNDYPFACSEMENVGSAAVAAYQETGGECRAAAGGTDALYVQNGTLTSWAQVCLPGSFNSSITQTLGSPLTCSLGLQYGVMLWRTDGIKVRTGTGTTLGQLPQLNAPLDTCGTDYTVWDVSAAGGGGSGGTQLFCLDLGTATLTHNNTTIVVADTSGIGAHVGSNILVVGDHGIQVATKVVSVTDGTHFVVSKAPYIDGTVHLSLTQIAVATTGAGFSRTCQTVPGQGSNLASCGFKIEIRFIHIPTNTTPFDLQWSDPTGYVAELADGVSDYVFLRPNVVGGYDIGLKHIGLSDGGIEFRPTYVELLNQCVAIEHQDPGGAAPFGDVVDIHRIVNDPIPNCNSAHYIDPLTKNTIFSFNNNREFLNGSSPYTPIPWVPTDVSGGGLSLTLHACTYNDVQSPIGNQVTTACNITYPSTADTNGAALTLPVSVAANSRVAGTINDDSGNVYYVTSAAGGTSLAITSSTGSNITNATLSTKKIQVNISYPGAS